MPDETASPSRATGDALAITALVRTLFRSFDSTEVPTGSLDRLPSLFTPDATVTVLSANGLRTQSVPDFIHPRRELLLGGRLTDFFERETHGETLLGPDVACHRSRYCKEGTREGTRFTGQGTKVFSFVRQNGTWRILSLLWQDDG